MTAIVTGWALTPALVLFVVSAVLFAVGFRASDRNGHL
jgi:hypothetical protein